MDATLPRYYYHVRLLQIALGAIVVRVNQKESGIRQDFKFPSVSLTGKEFEINSDFCVCLGPPASGLNRD